MAVYTQVPAEEMAALLARYDVGTLVSAKGIAEGVENSNYLVGTTQGRFILTLYEKRVDAGDLPFFLALLDHVADGGLPVPRAIRDRDGVQLQTVAGRPACLIEFLEGVSVTHPTPAQARAAGLALGRMHGTLASFPLSRPNSLGLEDWQALAARCGSDLDAISPGLRARVDEEVAFLTTHWPRNLATSVIHADLFPDNVLMLGDRVGGLIDFYFACTEIRAWDVAVTHAAWCFESDGTGFHPDLGAALIAGYDEGFGLSDGERAAFPILARGAALRFLLTRAWDWLNTPAGAMVTRKDPLAFLRRLDFYRGRQPAGVARRMTEMTHVEIATDGACKGNPGPGGWGAVIRSGDRERELSGGESPTTNNRMELMAAIRALEALKRPCRVTLSTDSRYVMDGLTKWIHGWRRNGWKTADRKPVKNADLWLELLAAAERHRIEWKWVKGHAGHPDNERADRLASNAALAAGHGAKASAGTL